jgi:hypothetical protein
LLPLPSLSHATLIADAMALACHPPPSFTIALTTLALLALLVAAFIMRHKLASFVVTHHCVHVVVDALLPATAHL